MDYNDEFLKKIRSFGVVQYSVDQIISILNPENPEQLKEDLKNEESVVHLMYMAGVNSGKYNQDMIQFSIQQSVAEVQKLKTQQYKQYAELKKELFGIGKDV